MYSDRAIASVHWPPHPHEYTPKKRFLLAFSFANFESWGVSFLDSVVNFYRNKNELLTFSVLPLVVSKFANEKARRNIFCGVYFLVFLPSFHPSVCHIPSSLSRWTHGCEVFVSMYITYISVSTSTPLAVTSPYGQLASYLFCMRKDNPLV